MYITNWIGNRPAAGKDFREKRELSMISNREINTKSLTVRSGGVFKTLHAQSLPEVDGQRHCLRKADCRVRDSHCLTADEMFREALQLLQMQVR